MPNKSHTLFDKVSNKIESILLTIYEIGIILLVGNIIRKEIEMKNPELKKKWYSKTLNIMELIVIAGFWLIVLYILLTLIF